MTDVIRMNDCNTHRFDRCLYRRGLETILIFRVLYGFENQFHMVLSSSYKTQLCSGFFGHNVVGDGFFLTLASGTYRLHLWTHLAYLWLEAPNAPSASTSLQQPTDTKEGFESTFDNFSFDIFLCEIDTVPPTTTLRCMQRLLPSKGTRLSTSLCTTDRGLEPIRDHYIYTYTHI